MRFFFFIICTIAIMANTKGQTPPISGKTHACAGSEVEYTYTGTEKDCYLHWRVFGGVFPGNFNQTTWKVDIDATKKIKVKWDANFFGTGYIQLDQDGCIKSRIQQNISIENLQLNLSADKTKINEGETARLTAYGTGQRFVWTCDKQPCNMSFSNAPIIDVSPRETTTYTCTTSGDYNNGDFITCSSSKTITITVNATPQVPDITNNIICCAQSICSGVTPSALNQFSGTTIGGGNGAFSYQWQSSSNGTTFANISGATSASYAPGALNQATWYQRVVSSGTKSSTSAPVKISVTLATLSIPTTTYSTNTIQRAGSITIVGNQTASSNVQVDFIAGNQIVVSPESVLSANINLKIGACTTSGQRILAENNDTNEAATSRLTSSENISYLSASPNPFDNETVIKYKVTQKGNVKLFISDQRGLVIATLVDKNNHDVGYSEYNFNSSGLKGGVYLYTLITNGHSEVKRLIVNH